MASVGQELLDVPLPDMVTKLALGIAEAQRALDENSVETAQILADTTIEVVPALTQLRNRARDFIGLLVKIRDERHHRAPPQMLGDLSQ